jgi:hypothetical protein
MIRIPNQTSNIREIFDEALQASYFHICQVFNLNREKTDMSYNELMDKREDEGYNHITIIHRPILNEDYDLDHYEFGISTNNLYLAIKVRPELAKKIINKFELK